MQMKYHRQKTMIFWNFSLLLFVLCTTIFKVQNSLAHKGGDKSHSDVDEKCKTKGQRFVLDFVQYECVLAEDPSSPNNLNYEALISGDIGSGVLIAKPIGCVPSSTSISPSSESGNKTESTKGEVIQIGETLEGPHFRYVCVHEEGNEGHNGGGTIALKITHCIDGAGNAIKVGDYFVEPMDGEGGRQFVSVECTGTEFLAKKTVHKWSKCVLPDGRRLIEGDFSVEQLECPEKSICEPNTDKWPLQRGEILSCLREDGEVTLKCTACVALNGNHVGISQYVQVLGQWAQCRVLPNEGCRLINVSSNYIDCTYEGRVYPHGSSFQSASNHSLFYCSYGQTIKQGCLLNDRLVLIGDVRYVDDKPFLCAQSDQVVSFNGIVGCDLPNGRFKRFMEVWRDDEGAIPVMKRCSWIHNSDGSVKRSEIRAYACVEGNTIVPVGKIRQRQNGEYYKCQRVEGDDKRLELHTLGDLDEELQQYTAKKIARRNLVEYFGVGGRALAASPQIRGRIFSAKTRSDEDLLELPKRLNCSNQLPYCHHLAGYCSFQTSLSENGGGLDVAYTELRDFQSRFERLQTNNGVAGTQQQQQPMSLTDLANLIPGCEDALSPFHKLQALVELACPVTCRKCLNGGQTDLVVARLEQTAHCGELGRRR